MSAEELDIITLLSQVIPKLSKVWESLHNLSMSIHLMFTMLWGSSTLLFLIHSSDFIVHLRYGRYGLGTGYIAMNSQINTSVLTGLLQWYTSQERKTKNRLQCLCCGIADCKLHPWCHHPMWALIPVLFCSTSLTHRSHSNIFSKTLLYFLFHF